MRVPFVPSASSSQADRSTTVAIWGDQGVFVPLGWAIEGLMQTDYGLNETEDSVAKPLDARIVAGDIAYAGLDIKVPLLNITNGDEEESIWDLYGMQQSALGSRRPLMFTFGNHDNFYDALAFQNRFASPSNAHATNGSSPYWYSFEVGNAHFLSLSSEHDYSKTSPQYAFASADLAAAAANKANVPWLVVNFHRPMYSSYASEYPAHHAGGLLQLDLEALLVKHGVSLVISGHIHSRERIHPVINGTVTDFPINITTPEGPSQAYRNPRAPAHMCTAMGGALQEDAWVHPVPAWSAIRGAGWLDSYGYVHL